MGDYFSIFKKLRSIRFTLIKRNSLSLILIALILSFSVSTRAESNADDGQCIGFWDWVQGCLDVGGVAEPTPFCDLTNAGISICRGNFSDAGVSLCGVIPYVGDAAKVGKYGSKIATACAKLPKPKFPWKLGNHKTAEKFRKQMETRGWTVGQIDEAIEKGTKYPAPNQVNPGNGATRYVHPDTGRSVVIDDVTGDVLHVGGDGFKY